MIFNRTKHHCFSPWLFLVHEHFQPAYRSSYRPHRRLGEFRPHSLRYSERFSSFRTHNRDIIATRIQRLLFRACSSSISRQAVGSLETIPKYSSHTRGTSFSRIQPKIGNTRETNRYVHVLCIF